MTSNQIALIREALLEEELAEMAVIDALPDEDIIFSEKYKLEMRKLINGYKKCVQSTNKVISKRLVGVLAAILITLTLMMSISAIREPIIKFIVNTYESFISIFAEEDNRVEPPEVIDRVNLPSYICNGYQLQNSENYEKLATTTWTNKDNFIIQLNQYILKDGLQAFLDNENLLYSILTTKLNNNIYYTDKNGYFNIVWTDDTYIYNLLCPNSTEITEIEKIIESMEVVED